MPALQKVIHDGLPIRLDGVAQPMRKRQSGKIWRVLADFGLKLVRCFGQWLGIPIKIDEIQARKLLNPHADKTIMLSRDTID
jgi:hypothetical protein